MNFIAKECFKQGREPLVPPLTEDQSFVLEDTAIRSNIVNDRMLPSSKLVSSGYDRSLTAPQPHTATAIPVPALQAYAFELSHEAPCLTAPPKPKNLRYYQPTRPPDRPEGDD